MRTSYTNCLSKRSNALLIENKEGKFPLWLAKKIREAQLQKIPYMLIVGEQEMNAKTVSIRKRDEVDNNLLSIEAFIKAPKQELLP